jgi:hypothetical protein
MRLLSHNNMADNGYARLSGRDSQSPLALVLSIDSPAPETVNQAWETKAPDFDTILSKIAAAGEKDPFAENIRFSEFFLSTKQPPLTPERK